MKAKDIMTKKVITVYPETEIMQAAKLLLDNHINGLPVVDEEGRLQGMICQSDLIAQQKKIPIPSFFLLLGGVIPMSSQQNIENRLNYYFRNNLKL